MSQWNAPRCGRAALLITLAIALGACARDGTGARDGEPSASATAPTRGSKARAPMVITEQPAPLQTQTVEPPPSPEGPDVEFVRPGTDVFTRQPKRTTASGDQPGEVTLNFENTNLLEVVKVVLGDLLSHNYVVDPRIQGAVTLQTSNPLPRDALLPTLEMILRVNGAAMVFRDGVYNIVPRQQAVGGLSVPELGGSSAPLPPGFAVRIVPLRFVGAAEMQRILEPFAVAGNIIRVDVARNLLILAGTRQELNSLLDTIQIFDVDWLAGMSVALFTPSFVEAETLAAELSNVFGDEVEGPLAGLVRFVPIERLNALLVVTPRKDYLSKVSEWVDRLDQDSGSAGRRLYVYHVQNGKAVELAEVLNQVFESEDTERLPPAELAPGLEAVETQSEAPASQQDAESQEGEPPPPPIPNLPSRVTNTAAEGVALSEGSQIRIIPDEPNNALLIRASEPEYRQVLAALRQLDIVPLQVLIEATIAEISLTDNFSYGLEWFFRNEGAGLVGEGLLDVSGTTTAAASLAASSGFSYVLSGTDVRVVLNLLATESKLNIISSPSLMVLNNQTANIRVGDEVPVQTQQRQSTDDTTSPIVNNIEFRDTGVQLSVTPRVNAGGLVTLEIEQEVSNVRGTSDPADPNLTPTIFTREIATSVAVQSGETLVLGGLIQENRNEGQSGIPVLHKLPVVGPLFGTTSNDLSRTELVVLITPRAVGDLNEARRVTEEFRAKMQSLKPRDKQGISKPGT